MGVGAGSTMLAGGGGTGWQKRWSRTIIPLVSMEGRPVKISLSVMNPTPCGALSGFRSAIRVDNVAEGCAITLAHREADRGALPRLHWASHWTKPPGAAELAPPKLSSSFDALSAAHWGVT